MSLQKGCEFSSLGAMSNRCKVVVTDFVEEPGTLEKEILGEFADVSILHAKGEENLVGKVEDADAIMIYHYVTIMRSTIDRLEKCKLIVRCGVGYDNIDYEYARERGIDVANVPDYGSEEVADSAIGMALALSRGFHFLNNRLRDDREAPWSYELAKPLNRLRGETFGIIGVGRIGTATALGHESGVLRSLRSRWSRQGVGHPPCGRSG